MSRYLWNKHCDFIIDDILLSQFKKQRTMH